MKKIKTTVGLLALSLMIFATSCDSKEKTQEATNASTVEKGEERVLTSAILTAEQQAKLTPQTVLDALKSGNQRFVNGKPTTSNSSKRIMDAVAGQYPEAVILSCLDSRVPVEDVFDRGIGDVFVARVAGNIVNEDILGSLEYACKVSGSKLVVVLGHEYCGAVKSAIKDVKLGNITPLLSKIRPAVAAAQKSFEGDKSVDNPDFVQAVCDHNIDLAIKEIRTKSPILKEMEDKGEIKIVGGVYDMETGKVTFSE